MNVATPTSNTVLRFWNCLAWRAESLEMLCKEVSAVTLIFLQHAAMLLIGIVRVPPGPLKSLKVLEFNRCKFNHFVTREEILWVQ